MRLWKLCVLSVFACAAVAGAESVSFQVLNGEETGLKKIVETWAADELKAQGGKYNDHGWWLWGLTSIDYDNDGAPDLVPTHHGPSGGLVLKNQFKKTGKLFFENVTAELGMASRELPTGIGRKTCAMDMNGDGWLDLVGIRSPHYINKEGKSFTPSANKKGFNTFHPLAIEDLNGDGLPDILEPVSMHLTDAAASDFKTQAFVHPCEAHVPQAIMDTMQELKKTIRFWGYRFISDFDLNGDGIADVVISGFAGYNGHPLGRFLTADASGALTDRTEEAGLPKDAAPILLADLNADGFVDMVSTRNTGGIYFNDGKGKFTLKPGPATDFLRKDGPYIHAVYPVDFDADGDLDLVIVNPRYKSTAVFENLGDGVFKSVHSQGSWDSDPVTICDFNDDGLPDIGIGGPENTITILLNTSKSAHFSNLYVRMDAPNPFAAGARVEAYKAGTLGTEGAHPFARAVIPSDGTPLHLGLGEATAFDVRVVFPGKEKKTVDYKNVAAQPKLKLTLDGKCEAMK